MKYTVARQSVFKKQKYDVFSGSHTAYAIYVKPSKERKGQYNVKISHPVSKHLSDDYCIIEPDPKTARNYLIYMNGRESTDSTIFGQLSYTFSSNNSYLYTITIGDKLYQVRSSDLRNRRLAVIDFLYQCGSSERSASQVFQYPETLFEVMDSFSKSNKAYHVTINDKLLQHSGYLAIVVLLDLHECKRG